MLPLRSTTQLPRHAPPSLSLGSLGHSHPCMSLDSPEAYERLGEHLCAVDPIVEAFCRETDFARRTTGISRYPMRRLDLHREVSWFIELRMEEDEHGQRYNHFFPDAPYWLCGGAWIATRARWPGSLQRMVERSRYAGCFAVRRRWGGLDLIVRSYAKFRI